MQYREHGRLRAETQGKRARRRYQRSWGNAPNLSILDIARYTARYKEATSSDEELGTPAHQAHDIGAIDVAIVGGGPAELLSASLSAHIRFGR